VWHARIAEWLEIAYGESAESVAAELAVHFDEAQDFARAVHYYSIAGDRAARRFGRADALVHVQRARALIAHLPPSPEVDALDLALLEQLGPLIVALNVFRDPRVVPTFTRAAALATRLGDDRKLASALLNLQRCRILSGDLRGVEAHAPALAEVVRRVADPLVEASATLVSASALFYRGRLRTPRRVFAEVWQILEATLPGSARQPIHPVVGIARGHQILASWWAGYPDEAAAYAEAGMSFAEGRSDPFVLANILLTSALVHTWRRDVPSARELARGALQVATDAGALFWQARALALFHCASVTLDPSSAEEHSDALSRGLAALSSVYGKTEIAPNVAEVYLRAGKRELALQEVEKALTYVEATDERAWESELLRVRGELTKDADMAQAEASFARALEVAHAQGAKSFELRAAMSLHRVATGARKRKQSHERLRRLYESFTEGFGTGDLTEVKSMLASG